MLRYNDLHLAVAIDRKRHSVAFQQSFVVFVQDSKQKNLAGRNGKFDDCLPPIQIWTETDVKNMAESHDTINNTTITKFACL